MEKFSVLRQKFDLIWPHLDERARRMVAATEARQMGYGGISEVSRACGLSRVTITKGIQELDAHDFKLSIPICLRIGGLG